MFSVNKNIIICLFKNVNLKFNKIYVIVINLYDFKLIVKSFNFFIYNKTII